MAQVAAIQQRQAAARAGNLDTQGQQDLKDLKTDLAVAKGEAVQLTELLCHKLAIASRRRTQKGLTQRRVQACGVTVALQTS